MFSLATLTLLLASAVATVVVFKRLGLGSVLAYLAAGALLGPAGLAAVDDVKAIFHFSEFGVVLLLFVIGLELQPARLWQLRRAVFGLGGAQVVLSGAALTGLALALGVAPIPALVAGLGLALSSTAFILPLLAQRGETHRPVGQQTFAILLFQDLAIIPLMALVTALAPPNPNAEASEPTWYLFARGLAALVGLLVAGRLLLRPAFRAAAQTGYREVFTALALLVVIGSGALMEAIGLSLSLGAFIAGVLLADSEYRHAVQAVIDPFKDLLLGLFFMSIGMSLNLGYFVAHPLQIILLTLGLILTKALTVYGAGRLLRLPGALAADTAAYLAQGGEFAFVLFGAAAYLGVLPAAVGDPLLVMVGLSMALTPGVIALRARLARAAPEDPVRPFDAIEDPSARVIIAGFGRVGQIVGRTLTTRGIPFTALEANPTNVDFVRKFGNKIHYGDATDEALLRAAHAHHAKAFVLAIDDVNTSVRCAEMVRHAFPDLPIFARARNRQHALALRALGVQITVRETLGASLSLAEEVLLRFGFEAAQARETVERFAAHDARVLDRQAAFKDDQEGLIQTAREAAAELEALFADDGKDPEAAGAAAEIPARTS